MAETKAAGLVILDIDGTLIEHYGSHYEQITRDSKVLAGVKDKLEEWDRAGWRIMLVTGRRESSRHHTEVQLMLEGIFYDQLIMGVGNGPRVLINDQKTDGRVTAFAFCPPRNEGIADVVLP